MTEGKCLALARPPHLKGQPIGILRQKWVQQVLPPARFTGDLSGVGYRNATRIPRRKINEKEKKGLKKTCREDTIVKNAKIM